MKKVFNKASIKKLMASTLIMTMAALLLLVAPPTAFASQRIINVSTMADIQNALKNALPGDEIVIAAGTYTGSTSTSGNTNSCFYSGVNGTSANHIIVRSADPNNKAVLQGSGTANNYDLYITGDYWEIRDLKFTNTQKGIVLDNSNYSLVYNCEVYNVGMEGIHLRDNSANNTVQNCNVHDTGKNNAGFGEGIYVGSADGSGYGAACNNNLITHCTIGPGVTAEHVDIKEGTTGTIVEYCIMNGTGISGQNFADSFVDAKGNNAIIRNNTCYRNNNSKIVDAFQVHQQIDGFGLNNDFNNNTVYLDTATPYVVNAPTGSAKASANTRNPSGNMYKGTVTQY